jgi:hypothetical protein
MIESTEVMKYTRMDERNQERKDVWKKERKDGMKDERKDELSERRAEQGRLNAVRDSAAQQKQHNITQYFTAPTAQHIQTTAALFDTYRSPCLPCHTLPYSSFPYSTLLQLSLPLLLSLTSSFPYSPVFPHLSFISSLPSPLLFSARFPHFSFLFFLLLLLFYCR